MKEKKNKPILEVSATDFGDPPEDATDMINRYGTYNIQPTANTANMYPTVAQGFNKKQIKTDCDNPEKERR